MTAPEDERTDTHKLNLELDANSGIFTFLPKGSYLDSVTAYTELDYMATGPPDQRDEAPKGKRVSLDDASPWTADIPVRAAALRTGNHNHKEGRQ